MKIIQGIALGIIMLISVPIVADTRQARNITVSRPGQTKVDQPKSSDFQLKRKPQDKSSMFKQFIDAIKENDVDQVKQIIADGVDVNQKTEIGLAPLHYAVADCKLEVIKMLLNSPDIVVDIQSDKTDDYKRTPLHYAAMNGCKKGGIFLINAGADIYAKEDTPFYTRSLTPIAIALNKQGDSFDAEWRQAFKEYQDALSSKKIRDEAKLMTELRATCSRLSAQENVKPVTFIFSHGLEGSRSQVLFYVYPEAGVKTERPPLDVITCPYFSFNFPDVGDKKGEVKSEMANLAQEGDIEALYKAYQAVQINPAYTHDVVLYGSSRGASTILTTLGSKKLDHVRAAVIEGAFDEAINSAMHRLGIIGYQWIAGKFTTYYYPGHKLDGISPLKVIADIPKDLPLLLVHSRDDEIVPFSSMEKIAQLLVESGHKNVNILILDHGKHGKYNLGPDAEEYRNGVHAFYKKYGIPYNPEYAHDGEAYLKDTTSIVQPKTESGKPVDQKQESSWYDSILSWWNGPKMDEGALARFPKPSEFTFIGDPRPAIMNLEKNIRAYKNKDTELYKNTVSEMISRYNEIYSQVARGGRRLEKRADFSSLLKD